MHERGVVTLHVMHGAAHARIDFAKEQVIRRDYSWAARLDTNTTRRFPKGRFYSHFEWTHGLFPLKFPPHRKDITHSFICREKRQK